MQIIHKSRKDYFFSSDRLATKLWGENLRSCCCQNWIAAITRSKTMEETEGGLEQQCRAHKASCRPGRDYVFTDGRSITTVVLWTARRRDNHGLLTFWSCTLFDVFRRNKPQGQKDLSIHQFWHLNQKVLCVVTHECHCPPEQVWRAEALHFTEYASKAKTCWWSNPRPMNLILDMLDQQTPIFFLWHVLWQNPLCFRHEKCQWPYLLVVDLLSTCSESPQCL